ncbi:hypothetical protein [Actinomycetospora sp. TBRC 11914]|uniref:hypothetical protein n=1 Tax=Actinomycetospora sp. TBRC 11914 TaxID=2729387 RepID=UPI0020071692|nr:hypothetical protein [Actinomycetospora sp. TBRC 11914]
MLLVAPDPRLGIAPERISRVRTLLDGLPTAPGLAVALPGGPEGELDAVVLRPDGILGLVPADASRRVRVGAGGSDGAGSQELAAAEIDRLLALADPTPTAPRQVVPIVDRRPPARSRHEDPERTDEDTGVGVATAARLVLTASAGPTVLDVAEVRRLLAAWRLAEFVPDGADLQAAGFPGSLPDDGSGRGRAAAASAPSIPPASPVSNPVSNPPWASPVSSSPVSSSPVSSNPVSSHPSTPPVPLARSSFASSPGGAPEESGPGRTGVLTEADQPRPLTAPMPVTPDSVVDAAPAPLGPWPDGGSGPRRRRERRARRLVPVGWLSTWRGLGITAVVTFGAALGVAALVVRGVSPAPEDVAAQPVRVVDGVSWTQRVVTTDPTCEGHAYGQAVQFLRQHPCAQLDRSLWSGTVGSSPLVASVAVVRMGDAASAAAFKALVDSSGTGNVADLLREGKGFPGAPASLSASAGYGSAQVGESVVIAETTVGAGAAAVGESTLDKVARQAVGLR